jgi:signal transduction histidine kinase
VLGRTVHLLLGGALALPYAGLVWLFVLATGSGQVLVTVLLAAVAVAGGVGVALLAPVRPLAVVVARTLLAVDLPDPPAGSRDGRLRAAAWFGLVLVTGAVAVLAVLVLLPQAVGFAVLPLTGDALRLGPDVTWRPGGLAWVLGPGLGLVALALTVLVLAGLGAWLARLAPWFLGPTPGEALAAERLRAGRLAWRARLAGELHDHLGHTLTAVTLQAGAGRRVLATDPEAAGAALAAIEERARGAVDELDRVLALLRDPDGADPGGLAEPAFADVTGLVEGIRATGREVALHLAGEPSATAGALAYRVVQEGLTNAVRHGAAGPVEVAVTTADGTTAVVVRNDVDPHRPSTARRGRGLDGLRERVGAAGGAVTTEVDGGVWTLRADLPGAS